MSYARIHGEPFDDSAAAGQLRSFLRFAVGNGMRCALSLSAVRDRGDGPETRTVPLTDGVREWSVATRLPPAEVELLMRAAAEPVPSTAPLVVFASDAEIEHAVTIAGLEWPQATAVVAVRRGVGAPELLTRLRAELRWAGSENPPHALSEACLRPWLRLVSPVAGGPIVHVAEDLFAGGTDLVVTAFLERFAATGRRLRLVLPGVADNAIAAVRERLHEHRRSVEIRSGAFVPGDVGDAAAVVLPRRQFADGRTLVQALASGVPVCASRWSATAPLLDGRAVVHAIGGASVVDDAEHGAFFAPDPRAVAAAIAFALAEPAGAATGQRARAHVVAELTRGRPATPPPTVARLGESRPLVVLEAPLFETSSTAELTLATAEALLRRGNVDLRLLPSAPFRHDLGWLRARAPGLESLLCRTPGRADLWLSAGWPMRVRRPDCRSWALRIDWEYGALPLELTPHATEDADVVVVHSEHVAGTVAAAGRTRATEIVPHGVDGVMHADVPPDQRVVQFKQGRPAVLFCGGLVWRKGFDVFLRAVLAARAAGHEFVVVVKSLGGDQHYGGCHLGGVLERFRATPGTPRLLHLDGAVSRPELASIYTACDLMLHPYRGEGFGLPVLEARACGLPVLATAGGATDALMQGPGATSLPAERRHIDLPTAHIARPWVLEPDAGAVAAALGRVLGDLDAQQRGARDLAPAVRAVFSWDAAAQSIERLAAAAGGRAQAAERLVTLTPQRPQTLPAVRS